MNVLPNIKNWAKPNKFVLSSFDSGIDGNKYLRPSEALSDRVPAIEFHCEVFVNPSGERSVLTFDCVRIGFLERSTLVGMSHRQVIAKWAPVIWSRTAFATADREIVTKMLDLTQPNTSGFQTFSDDDPFLERAPAERLRNAFFLKPREALFPMIQWLWDDWEAENAKWYKRATDLQELGVDSAIKEDNLRLICLSAGFYEPKRR